MESQRNESGLLLRLTADEQAALVRILRVVEDNWWLDELERDLLQRLESSDATLVPAV